MYRTFAMILLLAGVAGRLFCEGSIAAQDRSGAEERATPPPVGVPTPFRLRPVLERRLPNGLRVLVTEDRRLPLVTITVVVRSGASADPPGRTGVGQLTARLLTHGTALRSAAQIDSALDAMGGTVETSTELEMSLVSIKLLSNNVAAGFELVADIVTNPTFRPDEVERERARTLDEMLYLLRDPSHLAEAVCMRSLIGGTAGGFPLGGLPETIRAISRDDVARYHQGEFVPNNVVLSVSGDLGAIEAFALATRHFGSWRRAAQPPRPQASVSHPSPSSIRVLLVDTPGADVSAICVGRITPGGGDPSYHRQLVLSAAIAGVPFRSFLDREFRLKRGWGYGAQAYTRRASTSSNVSFFATRVKSEATADALHVLHRGITQEWRAAMSADDIDLAKRYVSGTTALRLQDPTFAARWLVAAEARGAGREEMAAFPTRIASVTVDDVRRSVEADLRPGNFVVVVVGPAARFEEQLRGAVAFEKIPFDELDLRVDSLRRSAVPGPGRNP